MKKPIFCGLTLKHIEIFIYWFFWNLYYCITCRCGFQWCHSTKKSKQGGARKRSGREKIKYSNYQPLDNKTYMSESEYEYGSQTTNQDEDDLDEMESGTLKLNNSRVGSSDVNSSIGNAEKSFKKSYFF